MSVTLESWQLGLLVAALAVALAAATALGVVVRRVSWEHPGIIAKSFNPGPDRRVRAAGPGSTLSSAGEPGAAVAVQVQPAKGRATPAAAVDDAAGAAPTTARRKSLVAMPLETPVADWEIDPRKLKMKYVVGKGNFGEVWLATWLGSPVAVKTIVPELQSKEKLVKRFMDEIMLMSTLHHPNVVLFLGACTRRPNLCLVLEFCVHGSLHHFLKSEASHGVRITMSLIYRFALDIARGVYYLHRRCSIVQRDLKARNILVDESLNAKVADFGLSRVLDEAEKNKLTACGTPAWTAPEIVKMEAYTDKVDVYSFGIILWELITRQEPYGGQKGVQIAYAAAEQGLRPEVPAYCPPDYAELMRACWADKPDDRPPFATILKKLFQMKKACDAEAGAEGGGDGAGAHAALPRHNVGGDESDDDSGGDSPVLHQARRPAPAPAPRAQQPPPPSPSRGAAAPAAAPGSSKRVSLVAGAPAQVLRIDVALPGAPAVVGGKAAAPPAATPSRGGAGAGVASMVRATSTASAVPAAAAAAAPAPSQALHGGGGTRAATATRETAAPADGGGGASRGRRVVVSVGGAHAPAAASAATAAAGDPASLPGFAGAAGAAAVVASAAPLQARPQQADRQAGAESRQPPPPPPPPPDASVRASTTGRPALSPRHPSPLPPAPAPAGGGPAASPQRSRPHLIAAWDGSVGSGDEEAVHPPAAGLAADTAPATPSDGDGDVLHALL